MMGVAQKAWFKEQLLAANGSYPIIIWVSTSPWLADTIWAGTDNWNGFRAERRELADFISENEIQGLFMISGDVHMLAIDDGSHNQYGSQNAPGFPIMQAAALSSTGTLLLGNSYSEGQYPGGGQFGLMTIEDDGTPALHIRWSGRNSIDEEVVTWEKSWGHRTYLPGIMAQ
jgi:hypothetical protein